MSKACALPLQRLLIKDKFCFPQKVQAEGAGLEPASPIARTPDFKSGALPIRLTLLIIFIALSNKFFKHILIKFLTLYFLKHVVKYEKDR
jgi:hypothetical protein